MRRGGEVPLVIASVLLGASIAGGLAIDKFPFKPSQINGQTPLNCSSEEGVSAYALKGSLVRGDSIGLGGGTTLTNKFFPAVEVFVGEDGETQVNTQNLKTHVTSNGTQASFVDAGIRYDVLSDPGTTKEVVLFDIILSCADKA